MSSAENFTQSAKQLISPSISMTAPDKSGYQSNIFPFISIKT